MNFLVLGHWDTKNQKSFKKVYFAYGFEGLYYTHPSERGIFLEKEVESLLQALSTGGTLESVEAALEKMKREKEQREFAIEKLGGEPKFEKKKKGDKIQEQYRYSTRVDGRQVSFTGKTPEVVYQKVWDFFQTGKRHLVKNATLEEVFEAAFEVRKLDTSLSSETYRNDRIDWNRFLKESKIAKMPIKDVSVRNLTDFFDSIIGRGNLTYKAASKPLTILKYTFGYATENGYCEHNIACEVNLSKYNFRAKEEVDIFTDEEVDTLLTYVENLPKTVYTLAIRLDFCFNMRVGELRALTWDDVNLDNKTVRIHHQVVMQEVNGKRTTVDLPYTKGGKESGIRVLHLSDEAVAIITELKKINGGKHYILQSKGKFPITTKHFNNHLRAFCDECGVTYHSSHNVRYLGITKLYEAGVDEATIQKTAGHSTIEMTRHYNKDRRACSVDSEVWNDLFGRRKKA